MLAAAPHGRVNRTVAPKAVAIYTRISRDPTGEQTATTRQERACRQYAQAQGWPVAGVWEEVEVSAYQPRTQRTAYEDLLVAVRAGHIDGVLVWKLDRLARRSGEFER